ncbi:YycH family regulatory protein [Jeotgalibacillus proteolyticus]|nr:two-component system activity regulator YycH [Jeotgalibacillus proteolyticus]
MNIEGFKSILLTLLVVLSGVLTWNVWTFQPTYDTIETAPTVDVSIADERTNSELIKPSQFLVHGTENVRGTSSESEIDELLSTMYDWTFFSLRYNAALSDSDIKDLTHGQNRVEIIFPTSIPFSAYQNVFDFETSQIPDDVFDRVVIQLPQEGDVTFPVYFISYDTKQVYEARVDLDELPPLNDKIVSKAEEEYASYFPYSAGSEKTLYLPQGTTEVVQYKYYMNSISPQQFRDALFSDPNAVSVNSLNSTEDQYLHQSSLMRIDSSTNTLNYVNPSAAEFTTAGGPSELLQKSRRFVNDHAGWTDNYYLYRLDPSVQEVTYRLHVEGLPVFNDRGVPHLAQMDQKWGDTRIFKYDRSLLSLHFEVPSTTQTTLLMTGYDVIETLESSDSFEPDLLQDVTVGYYISKDSSNDFYTLEPMWFYLYNGNWKRVPIDGGDPVGLE